MSSLVLWYISTETGLMNLADSYIVRNCSSRSSILNRWKWSRQQLPAASSVIVGFCTQEPTSCGSRCFVNCSVAFETDLSTPMDVWPSICSPLFTHHTNSILLRRYWADLPSESCEIKVQCFLDPLRSVSYFSSFSPKDASIERTCTSEYGMTTFCRVSNYLIGFIVTLSLWFMRIRSIPFFHFQDRGMTNVLAEIFSRNLLLLENSKNIPQNFPSMSDQCHWTPTWIELFPPTDLDLFVEFSDLCGFVWEPQPTWILRKYSTRTQLVLHRFQTTLRTNFVLMEIHWSGFSTLHSLLNDYAIFPDTRLNPSRHALLLSPTWLLDHDTESTSF